ncbi:hypothetical protein SAMN06295960_2237 [Paenibacillus aquistagni]|uniref:Uncharacterized protein n=1 Tax=Paenibacillus aquistagni TaxID=1852522 RepID=A0A1X7K9T0_9BACL|nr:hypothetical protein SAMN06295960_2237 [Paenibacillus aquistagni]
MGVGWKIMRKRDSVTVNTFKAEEVETSHVASQVVLDIRDILEHLDIPLEKVPDDLRHLFPNEHPGKNT